MPFTLPLRNLASLAVMVLALAPSAAGAQMTLIEDGRFLHTLARFDNLTDIDDLYPDGPYGRFEEVAQAVVERIVWCGPEPEDSCLVNHTDGYADQTSEFFNAGIQFTGWTAGSWQGSSTGLYETRSRARLKFRIDHPFKYEIHATLAPGDIPAQGLSGGHVLLEGPGGLQLIYLTEGSFADSSRLGPGEYVLEGLSWGDAVDESFIGAFYFAQWLVVEIPQPLVAYQPEDVTVACGGTATFTVGPSGTPASMTYQWRRNLQPLSNGGGISGATSPNLTIANACNSDAGYYDVLLSDGTVVEPSRLAQLSIVSAVTGVEDPTQGPRPQFAIKLAGPNPFHAQTSFRYEAAMPQRASIAIYNVTGARVRSLVDGLIEGTGTLRWDGRTDAAARAPAGIYFLRAETESAHESRRIVLLR